MAVIAIVNPKGGVGKSTVSTQLAGYLARHCAGSGGVVLADVDRQQSAGWWLSQRPSFLPPITLWEGDAEDLPPLSRRAAHAVLDTPAGLRGKRLDAVMAVADHVIVPLQASVFDIAATQAFLTQIAERRKHAKVPLAVMGNRVREHSHAAQQFQQWTASLQVPVLTHLRDTHNYVHLAAHGLCLWDVPTSQVARDLGQWQPVLDALELER